MIRNLVPQCPGRATLTLQIQIVRFDEFWGQHAKKKKKKKILWLLSERCYTQLKHMLVQETLCSVYLKVSSICP